MTYDRAEYEATQYYKITTEPQHCVCGKLMEREETGAIHPTTHLPFVQYKCTCGMHMIPVGQGYHGPADDVKRTANL